ncbi:MAG: YceI family protein [Candidatus Omnitrophota bacterium]|nr:YceI family protein [Candidatus Omnitrophota bacterium]MDZ4241714.1 YceI family protein [Candidatus Omnitrophota bacterium]
MRVSEIFGVLLLSATIFCSQATARAADTYTVDKDHSSIGFSVSHLMISTVRGEFTDYQGTIVFDPADPATIQIDAVLQAASVNTRQEKRDEHLKTADFFDVANNPTITFKSKDVKKDGDQYLITGDLTIREVTKEIQLSAAIQGPVKTPFGAEAIGISAQTKINRQDFGVSWNKTMDEGGYVVGDEVLLDVRIEAQKM